MRTKINKHKDIAKKTIAPLLALALVAPMFFCAPALPDTNKASAVSNTGSSAAETNFPAEDLSDAEFYKYETELNKRIAGEGSVLLKNKDNALPLKPASEKVTMFHSLYTTWDDGVNGDSGSGNGHILVAGGGSGAILIRDRDQFSEVQRNLYQGFDDNGLKYNPTMKKLYDDNSSVLSNNCKQSIWAHKNKSI